MSTKLDKARYGLKQVLEAWCLNYFLGFQIEKSERVISINKEIYVNDLLRKYDKIGSSVNTPIMPPDMLGPDLNCKAVNESQYKAMFSTDANDVVVAGCCANILWITSYLTDYDNIYEKITNKDAIILYSLENGINIDYASIFWEDIIIKLNKQHKEKVVPYTTFISLLMMHKMKEDYGDGELTLYPT
ncbi:hypothetical protein Tco_1251649 [Tanacetum coccineum]